MDLRGTNMQQFFTKRGRTPMSMKKKDCLFSAVSQALGTQQALIRSVWEALWGEGDALRLLIQRLLLKPAAACCR